MQNTLDFSQENRDPIILEPPIKQQRMTPEHMTANFLKYHMNNPQVYEHFKRITLEMFNRGYEQFSIMGVVEIYRWNTYDKTSDTKFKFCNTHKTFYARLLACDMPTIRHWFRFKKCKADNDAFYAFLMIETDCGEPLAIFHPPKEKAPACCRG